MRVWANFSYYTAFRNLEYWKITIHFALLLVRERGVTGAARDVGSIQKVKVVHTIIQQRSRIWWKHWEASHLPLPADDLQNKLSLKCTSLFPVRMEVYSQNALFAVWVEHIPRAIFAASTQERAKNWWNIYLQHNCNSTDEGALCRHTMVKALFMVPISLLPSAQSSFAALLSLLPPTQAP